MIEELSMVPQRVRINVRSIICLEKVGFFASDRCALVTVSGDQAGASSTRTWPDSPDGAPAHWPAIRKWDWVFKGDEQAIPVWEQSIERGAAHLVQVFVLRPAGSSDAKIVGEFAKSAEPMMKIAGEVLGGLAGAALLAGRMPASASKAAMKAAQAVGGKAGAALGGAMLAGLTQVLQSKAVKELLDNDGTRVLGSFALRVANVDGEIVPHIAGGPGVSTKGWRRFATVYPSPSKSGKTMRLKVSQGGGLYGIEIQIRNMSRTAPDHPNGMCHLWTEEQVVTTDSPPSAPE